MEVKKNIQKKHFNYFSLKNVIFQMEKQRNSVKEAFG